MFEYRAEMQRVVDGDTVDFLVDLGFKVHTKVRVRLYGVDTPEVRTRDAAEKIAGKAASQYTKDWFAEHGNVCRLKTTKGTGKFGRWLGVITDLDGENELNQGLLDTGNAKPYMV